MKIGFFGGGKMAEGIISAMQDRSQVLVAERDGARGRELKRHYGVEVTDDVSMVADQCEIIFLAVRPQDVESVACFARQHLTHRQTIVSIVAGRTIARLRRTFGKNVRFSRVMPNLAIRAKAGMCAITYGEEVSRAHRRIIEGILGGAGEKVILEERLLDAVTALSGSGPAYFACLAATLAEAGTALGLDEKTATLLSMQTMYGTAKFLKESKMELKAFIESVSTPGGTTSAGLTRLDTPIFHQIIADTVRAAAKRSRELA